MGEVYCMHSAVEKRRGSERKCKEEVLTLQSWGSCYCGIADNINVVLDSKGQAA